MKSRELRQAFLQPELPLSAAAVPLVAQETDFSCGPAALLAVFKYFGVDRGQSEQDLYDELDTTSKWGTSPEPMADATRARGLDADYEVGYSLDSLRSALSQGAVAIVGIQAWADDNVPGEDENEEYVDDTSDGHYVVAIGMDDDNLYCMDPSLEGKYAYLPLDEFAERWHDVEGDGSFEHHPAIVIYGQPAIDEVETTDLARMG